MKEVRGKRNGKKWWILLLVLVVIGGGGAYYYQKKKEQAAAPTYTETTAERGDMQLTVLSTGTVQPQNRLEIKPPIAGRVEKVLVEEGARVKQGQILAWMSSNERAALLDAARSRGTAELARWEDLYRPTPIIAPINGMIILKKVEPGQSFSNADALLVISDRLTVKALVDETDLGKIKIGQEAQIVLDAYPDSPLAAVVDKIAYDSKAENNVTTYAVDVSPKSTPEYMRSGMTANVTFQIENRKDVLLVDSEALKTSGDKTVVLIKNPEAKAPPLEKEVKTGLSNGQKIEIVSGIEAGQVVLIPEMVLSPDGAKKSGSPFSPFGGGGRPRKRN